MTPLKLKLILLIGLSLTACATVASKAPRFSCPPLVSYTDDEQNRVEDLRQTLPIDHPARRMITDYGALRNACRAL